MVVYYADGHRSLQPLANKLKWKTCGSNVESTTLVVSIYYEIVSSFASESRTDELNNCSLRLGIKI